MNYEEQNQAMRPMPEYQSHKRVWALKIKDVFCPPPPEGHESDGSWRLAVEEEGYAPIRVSAEYMRKHKPERGGYYVRYSDGYESWSPAKAFEDGYTRV